MDRCMNRVLLGAMFSVFAAADAVAQESATGSPDEGGWWQWVMLLFVAGMVLSIIHSIKLLKRSARPDAGYWLRRFEQACLKHEPATASQSLLYWAKAMWGADAPTSLGGIAARLDRKDVSLQLQQLQETVRNRGEGQWNAYLCRQVLVESLGQLAPDEAPSQADGP
ncbi:MAG: hypothetical protein ABW116_12995 [Candidatus Sedimenticola sp. 20ELBAFRAG]